MRGAGEAARFGWEWLSLHRKNPSAKGRLTTPSSVYEHDLNAATDTLLKQQEVVGAFAAKDYVSERLWVPVRDGEKVPVSIVYRKGTRIDGTSPLLLYGYGSYGVTEAQFRNRPISVANSLGDIIDAIRKHKV